MTEMKEIGEQSQTAIENRVLLKRPQDFPVSMIWRRQRYADLTQGKMKPNHLGEQKELAHEIKVLTERYHILKRDEEAPSIFEIDGRLLRLDEALKKLEERKSAEVYFERQGMLIRREILVRRKNELKSKTRVVVLNKTGEIIVPDQNENKQSRKHSTDNNAKETDDKNTAFEDSKFSGDSFHRGDTAPMRVVGKQNGSNINNQEHLVLDDSSQWVKPVWCSWHTFLEFGLFYESSNFQQAIQEGRRTYAEIQEDYITKNPFYNSLDDPNEHMLSNSTIISTKWPFGPRTSLKEFKKKQVEELYEIFTGDSHKIPKVISRRYLRDELKLSEIYDYLIKSNEHEQWIINANRIFYSFDQIVGRKPDFYEYDYFLQMYKHGMALNEITQRLELEKKQLMDPLFIVQFQQTFTDVRTIYSECFGLVSDPILPAYRQTRSLMEGKTSYPKIREQLLTSERKRGYLKLLSSSTFLLRNNEVQQIYEALMKEQLAPSEREKYLRMDPENVVHAIINSPRYKLRKRTSDEIARLYRLHFQRNATLQELDYYSQIIMKKSIPVRKIKKSMDTIWQTETLIA